MRGDEGETAAWLVGEERRGKRMKGKRETLPLAEILIYSFMHVICLYIMGICLSFHTCPFIIKQCVDSLVKSTLIHNLFVRFVMLHITLAQFHKFISFGKRMLILFLTPGKIPRCEKWQKYETFSLVEQISILCPDCIYTLQKLNHIWIYTLVMYSFMCWDENLVVKSNSQNVYP